MGAQMEHWKLESNLKKSMGVKKLSYAPEKRSLVWEQHTFMASDMQLGISF